ncbi:MAG: hypothetical protein ABI661_02335, partial [Gammaproteobacteria bacterium]
LVHGDEEQPVRGATAGAAWRTELIADRLLPWLLAAVWATGLATVPAAGDTPLRLQVTGLDPEANYEPTRDPADRAQLTDGRLNRFPFWTRRESVGWVNRTPVRITAMADVQDGLFYTVTIRAAMGASAGVYPPRRVDVYCGDGTAAGPRHAGALNHARNPAEDNGVVDLPVTFAGCRGGRLELVLHADGPFVLIDELTLRRAASGPESTAAGITNPVTDSRRRLEAGLMMSGRAELGRSVRQRVSAPAAAWLAEAWGPLAVPVVGTARAKLVVPVAANGPVNVVVGIANAGNVTRRYTANLSATTPLTPTISRLLPVLAADGQLVFDAIDKLPASAWDVEAGGVLYLLVSEPGGGPAGTRRIAVTDDNGWKQELNLDVQVLDRLRPGPGDQPRVLVWTYTNDKPIWRPETAAGIAASLAAAGVNVVDIHPAHIPAPLEERDWPARTAALKADLALFRGKALALLFLGGAPWERLASLSADAATERRLAAWVSTLKDVMRESGYGVDDWALYLIDEPRGEDLSRLATVITRLRAIDGDLRFYANPTLGRGEQVTALPALWKLKSLVDYWQPRAGPAFDAVSTVLGKSAGDRLWMYDNPREPARSTLPACYRALGTRAFDAGARGLGFWSFSNTNDSSAWSDFDGRQPDWAVVYEAEAGFVSSRRWEAFQQGVRDFAVLSYCARKATGDPALRAQCAAYRPALDAALRADCSQ